MDQGFPGGGKISRLGEQGRKTELKVKFRIFNIVEGIIFKSKV